MAIFTTTGVHPLNMGDPIAFGSLLDSDQLGGTSSAAFARRNAATGEQWQFTGTGFGSYSDGMPNSGTITSIAYTNGTNVVTITNVSLAAGPMLSLLINGNWDQIIISLLAGDDTASGTSLADTLVGSSGNDTLNGGDGNDRIGGGAGNDIMNGAAGDDTFETLFFQDNTGIDTIDGGDGNDVLWLARTGSTPFVFRMDGANTASGVTLSDGTVIRNVEGFNISAGNGNDTFVAAMLAPAFGCAFYGGGGIDTFEINLSSATESFHWVGSSEFQLGNVAGYQLDPSVERLVVTTGSGADFIRGAMGDDVLAGSGGNDELLGAAGNDTLLGGAGNDLLHGGNYFTGGDGVGDGFDIASYADADAGVTVSLLLQDQAQQTFGAGLDSLSSIDGLIGSAHNDTLTGSDDVNTLRGGEGADTLNGGGGADTLDGEGGDDVIFWDAADTPVNINGGSGNDTLVFTSGVAPVSFNLAAQGFEAAQGRFTVTGATYTDHYDAQWRLSEQRGNATNGSSWFIDWDETSALPYQRLNQDFNASAQLAREYGLADNGSTWNQYFDVADNQPWVSLQQVHTAGGVFATESGIADTGSAWTRFFDVDGDNPFVWVEQVRTAGGVLAQEEGLADVGSRWFRDFDETGTADFQWYENIFDSSDRLTSQTGLYDNGHTWIIDYDETDAYAWASIRRDFDENGVLISMIETPDGP